MHEGYACRPACAASDAPGAWSQTGYIGSEQPVPRMSAPPDPFAYVVDPGEAIAYARMWGVVSGADMLQLARAVHADPLWECGFDAVWDCSAVRAHVVAPGDVDPIVREAAASGQGRDVLVQSRADGDGAIAQMLAAFCRRSGKAMTVHATLSDALAALGREALPAALTDTR